MVHLDLPREFVRVPPRNQIEEQVSKQHTQTEASWTNINMYKNYYCFHTIYRYNLREMSWELNFLWSMFSRLVLICPDIRGNFHFNLKNGWF